MCCRQHPLHIPKKKDPETLIEPDRQFCLTDVDLDDLLPAGRPACRRTHQKTSTPSGRYHRARPARPGERLADFALAATLRQALRRLLSSRSSRPQPWQILPQDFQLKQRERPSDPLFVFVVDASDSMGEGAATRMRAAKGAILAILRKAYLHRSRVALIAFGGEQATVVLPPTRSIHRAQYCLHQLRIGGATPLAHGLNQAWLLARLERLKSKTVQPLLLVISDGQANVPLIEGHPPFREVLQLAACIHQDHVHSILVDVTSHYEKSLEMRQIAQMLGARYLKVDDLKSRHLLKALALRDGPTGLA